MKRICKTFLTFDNQRIVVSFYIDSFSIQQHYISGRFALVNVGSMPLLLNWGLAKGTDFFNVEGISGTVVNYR
jgi:hypothetical protein